VTGEEGEERERERERERVTAQRHRPIRVEPGFCACPTQGEPFLFLFFSPPILSSPAHTYLLPLLSVATRPTLVVSTRSPLSLSPYSFLEENAEGMNLRGPAVAPTAPSALSITEDTSRPRPLPRH
jgi:hypothetical protein